MLPTLDPDDRISIKASNQYWPGDLVAYHSSYFNFNVVHRYLGSVWTGRSTKIILIPDNGNCPDILIRPEEILGKVISHNNQVVQISKGIRTRAIIQYMFWYCKIVARKLFGKKLS